MIEHLSGVVCDKCGQSTGGIARNANDARDEAIRQGWGGGHYGLDLCPSCKKPTCQMTMGGDNGASSYYECERLAKFMFLDRLRGNIRVCGIHAKGRTVTPIGK